jgi:hypothetical protein
MTVERLLRILISAIRKQGFFKGLWAHQLPMRAQRVGGELVLVGGQQPIGTDLGRSATQPRDSDTYETLYRGYCDVPRNETIVHQLAQVQEEQAVA